MLKQIAFSAMGLAAAAALPIIFFSVSDYWKSARGGGNGSVAAAASPDGSAMAITPPILSMEASPVRSLEEIIRFDITPDWVMHRWPRVTTGLAELQLQGYRVPLVTGTAENDLAGSLTYYFNPQQRPQRITFRGYTGNPRNLVTLVAGQYRFARRPASDASVVLFETVHPDGRPAGSLRLRTAPVVKVTEANRRYEVELLIEHPEG